MIRNIALNEDWTVEYFDPDIDGFEMAPAAEAVARLGDWRCEARFAQAGFYAWLGRQFRLEGTDHCVRYLLQVEQAPPNTRLYINDVHVSDCTDPVVRVDITDQVTLGRNRINMRVGCIAGDMERFDAVYLLQVPCDEASSAPA